MKRIDDATAVLLCGGANARLGYPKEMLRADGDPLAVKMARRLGALFPKVMISTNRPERLRHLVDVPLIEDDIKGVGPLGGMLSALRRAETKWLFFIACDMPGASDDAIVHLMEEAERSPHPAAMAVVGGRVQPVFCTVESRLAPMLGELMKDERSRAILALFDRSGVEKVDFSGWPPWTFADIDSPDDLWILRRFYRDVEPLPVRFEPIIRTGESSERMDIVAEEWPVAIYANSIKLATVLCLPSALKEMAVGFACYLGLVRRAEDILNVEPDYDERRVRMELNVDIDLVRGAVRDLVTSSCGSSVFGRPVSVEGLASGTGESVIEVDSIIEWLKMLRAAAPTFEMTGATHQAAYCEENRMIYMYEDVGRHNALDKVLGRALMDGRNLEKGVLLATGRLSSEMVVKALRLNVPVVAGRSAVTTHALDLARDRGLTVIGFARAGRLNIYTHPERVAGLSGAHTEVER